MREIPLPDGQAFHVSDRVLLVTSRESVIGIASQFGAPDAGDQLAYLLTFEGKVNGKPRTGSVTVAMSPVDAHAMIEEMLRGLELLTASNRVEAGRQLANTRDDLIAGGVSPADLLPPITLDDALDPTDEEK